MLVLKFFWKFNINNRFCCYLQNCSCSVSTVLLLSFTTGFIFCYWHLLRRFRLLLKLNMTSKFSEWYCRIWLFKHGMHRATLWISMKYHYNNSYIKQSWELKWNSVGMVSWGTEVRDLIGGYTLFFKDCCFWLACLTWIILGDSCCQALVKVLNSKKQTNTK